MSSFLCPVFNKLKRHGVLIERVPHKEDWKPRELLGSNAMENGSWHRRKHGWLSRQVPEDAFKYFIKTFTGDWERRS